LHNAQLDTILKQLAVFFSSICVTESQKIQLETEAGLVDRCWSSGATVQDGHDG